MTSRGIRWTLGVAVVLLPLIGVAASAAHYLQEPNNPGYLKFPTITALHVVLGGIYLALAPFEFVKRVRSSHLTYHRHPDYFGRLRDYVVAAGEEGIYVSVMPFEGFGLHLSLHPDSVEGHPFHAANNVNDIASINDYQVLPLDERVQALQEAYVRKVIDTIHDLPGILYEVANESSGGGSVDARFLEAIGLSEPPDWGDSTQWQYWIIDQVKRYEEEMGYTKHPVGMTMQYPVRDQSKVNDVLFDGPADWISPGFDDVASPMQNSRLLTDRPQTTGRRSSSATPTTTRP